MKPSFVIFLAGLVGVPSAAQPQPAGPLRLEQTIPMPGVEGRIDHLSVDLRGSRLFVAALENNTVEVLDLRAGKRIHTIGGLQESQGLVYLPESDRIAVANGGDGACRFFDAKTFQPGQVVSLSEDADNVRYDRASQRLYVGYGKGAIGIVDATTGRRLGDIKLEGHPESFQLEQSGPRIFVNVPTAGHIAVLDREKQAVATRWPVTRAGANFPMALDESNHRLFIGCRKPAVMLVFDTTRGQAVARLSSAGDADDLFYDARRKRVYLSGGEGFISVFDQQDANHYQEIARIPTAARARTSLFVPELDRLFVAVPHVGDQAAEARVYEIRP